MGYIRKALEKGYLEHLSLHAVLTVCLRFLSVLDHAGVACCLFLSTGSYHVRIQIHGLLLPRMHHKSLWCTKGLALGEHSGCGCNGISLVAGSQQPACTHKEHQILTNAETSQPTACGPCLSTQGGCL